MAEFFPRDLIGAVGNDFIRVHIGLGPGTRLPDYQGKMSVQPTGDHFVRRRADCFQFLSRHLLRFQGMIGACRRLLQDAECPDDLLGHGLNADTDRKVSAAPLCLGRPVFICRYSDLPH